MVLGPPPLNSYCIPLLGTIVINPRRACAERVTAVVSLFKVLCNVYNVYTCSVQVIMKPLIYIPTFFTGPNHES